MSCQALTNPLTGRFETHAHSSPPYPKLIPNTRTLSLPSTAFTSSPPSQLCFYISLSLQSRTNKKLQLCLVFSTNHIEGRSGGGVFSYLFLALMDAQLLKNGLDFSRRRNKWLLLFAACGFTGYGLYRVYRSPFIAQKRNRVLKLLGAMISLAEAVSDSAEAIRVVSKDMKEFLQSDSDQIPNSLKQISKITRSNEFSESVVSITRALTLGVLLGYRSKAKTDGVVATDSSFMDRVMDKLFTKAGSGFASAVVGSFARNLVMAFYSDGQFSRELHSNSTTSIGTDTAGFENNSVQRWVNVVFSEKCRELTGDCIQLFVSTMVTVYLDKTMHVNSFDEFFAGLTNPKHDEKVKDVLVAACNGAVETLVKASHQVLTSTDSSSGSPFMAIDPNRQNGWVRKVSSTLSEPSNRRFVLDTTGRATFEVVRSFFEVLLQKLYDGLNRSVDVGHETVVRSGIEVVKYVSAKSSALGTLCISLCLHILDGVWIMVRA